MEVMTTSEEKEETWRKERVQTLERVAEDLQNVYDWVKADHYPKEDQKAIREAIEVVIRYGSEQLGM